MPDARNLIVSSPYPEGAARALIAEATRRGALTGEIVPRSFLVARIAALPLPARLRTSEFGRRILVLRQKYAAITTHPVLRVSALAELILRAGLRLPNPGLVLRASYISKILFDRSAARITMSESDTLLGFPGACLATFSAHPTVRKVFHAVDAHPRAHNRELLAHFSRRTTWNERFPPRLIRRIEKELRLADTVLTPSSIVTRQMIHYGVDPAKILEVPYGVSLEGFTPFGESVERNPDRPRLICAAHVSYRKGFPQLLDAVRGLDVDLVIAGGIFDPKILRSAPRNLIVRGLLTPGELAREYRSADAFVLPTLEDACSLVVAEAAASGLPVITTDANGASALLDPRLSVVLRPGDVTALRDAISAVEILDSAQRASNAASARAGSDGGSRVVDWPRYSRQVLDRILRE